MRRHGSPQELERRRREAVALVQQGCAPKEAAQRVGASRRSVERWCQAFRERGDEALTAKPHPGRKAYLSRQQKQDLRRRLLGGAAREGFANDLWTCPRVQQLILKRYGVAYHVNHLPRLLAALGFSRQKPTRKSSERDEAQIERWVSLDWPRIKKRGVGLART